jgi:ribosomal protein S18 acetylase RimI-like enzyme
MLVRPVREDEWPALVALERACFGDHGYSPYLLRMAPRVFGDACLVAWADERLLGYALGALESRHREVGWVLSIAVLPEARGRGLGEALTRSCVAALEIAGAEVVRLTVAPDNRAAVRLYRRLGFAVAEEVPDFFGPGQDRLVMTLRPAAS